MDPLLHAGFAHLWFVTIHAVLTKSSQDTAHRDITDLLERGALRKDPGGGRSTSYSLVDPGELESPQDMR